MNTGKYVFSQIVDFLPKRSFDNLVRKYNGDRYVKTLTCWNQLLIMMFGQLCGCDSLRETVCVINAIKNKSFHLGFGRSRISLSNMAYANSRRDCRIFEEYAYKMIALAQSKRLGRDFELYGQFYAFDSTTIDLCLSLFKWASFRKTKAGIKMHTLFDVVTQIPTYIHITNAQIHDVNVMDEIPYEPNAFYIFDKGYYDLKRLYNIHLLDSFFIIRQKTSLKYKITEEMDMLEEDNGVMKDQFIKLTNYQSKSKYPYRLRRVVYHAADINKTFIFLTNNFTLKSKDIAMLYKQRWQVELFFKWIKQHLKVKSFWGNSENAVRIQLYTAIITYCLIGIVEYECRLNRSTFNVLRVVSKVLTDKTNIRDLFNDAEVINDDCEYLGQLKIPFRF